MEDRLDGLEQDYLNRLVEALRQCQNGRWGVFGRNDHLYKVDSPTDELVTLGALIRALRNELGIVDAFKPHERFLHYRSIRGPNAPGEPRLAEAFLDELGFPSSVQIDEVR